MSLGGTLFYKIWRLWRIVDVAVLASKTNVGYAHEILGSLEGRHKRECPICGYSGYFKAIGMPPRFDAQCPKCLSVERHRLLWLLLKQDISIEAEASVLHFSPEPALKSLFREMYAEYKTSDFTGDGADYRLNIEKLDLPNAAFDTIFCNHVLEHVDDRKSLDELYRVLKPSGSTIVTIPIIEGWSKTYEDPGITAENERELHFGQNNHVRYFGSDFRERAKAAGFSVREFTLSGQEAAQYGLIRGEKVYVLVKPAN